MYRQLYTSVRIQILLALSGKSQGATSASNHTAGLKKSPWHTLVAMRLEKLRENPHGQGTIWTTPICVSGQNITMSRRSFPSGDSSIVVSGGQVSVHKGRNIIHSHAYTLTNYYTPTNKNTTHIYSSKLLLFQNF